MAGTGALEHYNELPSQQAPHSGVLLQFAVCSLQYTSTLVMSYASSTVQLPCPL